MIITPISFCVFLSLWNRMQGQGTPDLHFRIAGWMEHCWQNGKKRLLMTVFRGAGKSTLAAIFVAWLLSVNPDLRILVLSADTSLAQKMVRNTKRIIEKHPLTSSLKPNNPDQWASDRFTVNRRMESRDPSFLAKGVSANITGLRADIIICDDVEVPNTCATFTKREELRTRLGETEFILTPDGTQFYLGTPHSWYSIYAEEPRVEINEDRVFLQGFERLKIPVLNEQGDSAWPERFSEVDLQENLIKSGPIAFASQMMLEPMNIVQARLDPALLSIYDQDLVYSEAQTLIQLSLGDRKIVSISGWWDPSFGATNSDASVFAIILADDEGEYWLHHLEYIRTEVNTDQDEATQQCQVVTKLAERYYVPSIAVETNGIGRFLPSILRRELAKANVPASVLEVSSTTAKDQRILQAFDTVMAAKALHIHKRITQTLFLSEMRDWQPGRTRAKDDGLDAVAGALSMEPVRIKRQYPNKFIKNWRSSAHTAKTEFEI